MDLRHRVRVLVGMAERSLHECEQVPTVAVAREISPEVWWPGELLRPIRDQPGDHSGGSALADPEDDAADLRGGGHGLRFEPLLELDEGFGAADRSDGLAHRLPCLNSVPAGVPHRGGGAEAVSGVLGLEAPAGECEMPGWTVLR